MDELAIATMRTLSTDAVLKPRSVHTFGASAPLEDLVGRFGFIPDAVADAAWGVSARGAAA